MVHAEQPTVFVPWPHSAFSAKNEGLAIHWQEYGEEYRKIIGAEGLADFGLCAGRAELFVDYGKAYDRSAYMA